LTDTNPLKFLHTTIKSPHNLKPNSASLYKYERDLFSTINRVALFIPFLITSVFS